ncbi:MAG: hypothetical protein HFH58_06350 [Lachnospiraceae bacterium]|jgi:hypothetical protein|nr:hypothetical protein [Lachnospiraceae bacterium]MCI9099468.1 hypothetical protein [Lachnospiraceae bacterium]
MKWKKAIVCLAWILVLLCVPAASVEVKAGARSGESQMQVNAKAGKKYKKLYKKFLAKGVIKGKSGSRGVINWYYLININKSGAPELVVMQDGGGLATYYIYTISGGKVKLCGECTAKGISSAPPVLKYVSKYKGIETSGWTNGIGGVWSNLFQVSKGKLVHKYHVRSAEYPKKEYYIGTTDTKCRKVGKAACNRYYKKYFSKAKTYKMIKNTAANRNRTFR